jgi:hypothetical protein
MQERLSMIAFGIALSILVALVAVVRRRRQEARAIEVGTVSPGWLAELKLGKRETNWE